MINVGMYAPGSTAALTPTRGRVQGGLTGMRYPSPFFDIAHTYLPTTVKQLFGWCRYYFLTFSIVNATIFKLSEYPITDLLFDHENKEVAEHWLTYFRKRLRYRMFQIEMNLDYHCYGNAFASIGYPFTKFLSCRGCSFSAPANKIRKHWRVSDFKFYLKCPKCERHGEAKVKDQYFRNPSGIKLIRWNPEDIEIRYNDLTADYTYYYTIPSTVINDIVLGRKEVLEGTPQLFMEAARQRKGIVFSKDSLFHMRRPALSSPDRGWGTPLLFPVLKDAFYLQIMQKSQESILLEHIVPLRVIFPQAASGTSDVYSNVSLVDWREHIAAEIARWRHDANYIPILPLPIGNQTIGGDGRALLLSAEIQQRMEFLIEGMGVPREFLQGGLSYAGTNVSMRMLENTFIGNVLQQKDLAEWVTQEIAMYLRWPMATPRFKSFKMADDLQRKAFDLQLHQSKLLSGTTLMAGLDYDLEEETKIAEKETAYRTQALRTQMLSEAEIQGEVQSVMVKAQMKTQQAMQAQPLAPGEPGAEGSEDAQAYAPGEMASPLHAGQQLPNGAVDLLTMARMQAQVISGMAPDQQDRAIQSIYSQSQEFGDLVVQTLRQLQGGQAPPTGGVDMRPLPEQRAPRRETAIV